jgi:tetratricopeptide (TPR) repeat protein
MRSMQLALFMVVLHTTAAHGRMLSSDVKTVPVARIIKNLSAAAKKQPDDPFIPMNIARTHAMVYATHATKDQINKNIVLPEPWFGNNHAAVPFKATPAKNERQKKKAEEHLQKAIASYKKALELDPELLEAQLGLAWCIEQSGDKPGAIQAYRAVIEKSWAQEKGYSTVGEHSVTVTADAVGYLIPLLDKEKEKAEIAELTKRASKLESLPRAISPIVIPLRANASAGELEDRTARVTFDADGTGRQKSWSWVTPAAGWLVWDPETSGAVSSSLQLFGQRTHLLIWENGYQALSALDDNFDGELTGRELTGLAIWHDSNGDGVSNKSEVKSLSEHGIVALSCQHQRDATHPDRIEYSPAGVRFRDGSTRPTFDLILKAR